MTPQARRRLVPIIVILAAAGILLSIVLGPKRTTTPTPEPVETPIVVEAPKETPPEFVPDETIVANPSPTANVTSAIGTLSLQSFETQEESIVLGSLHELEKWQLQATLTHAGAGIESIRFSNIFETVDGKLAWQKYRTSGGDVPSIDDLYLLAKAREFQYRTASGNATTTASILGASQIIVNEQILHLTSPTYWRKTAQDGNSSTSFEAVVIDEEDNRVVTINRTWTLNDQFEFYVEQTIQNHTSGELQIQWLQYGPPSLTVDRSRYMDRRRFSFWMGIVGRI